MQWRPRLRCTLWDGVGAHKVWKEERWCSATDCFRTTLRLYILGAHATACLRLRGVSRRAAVISDKQDTARGVWR